MSDPIDRAVDASVAAHTPTAVPPFEALQARKARRDRRRAGAAISFTALAVAAVVVVPPTLTGDGPTVGLVGRDPAPSSAPGGLPCATTARFIYGLADSTGGAASPEDAAREFGARPAAEAGYRRQEWRRGETKSNGEVVVVGQTAELHTWQGSDGTWFVVSGNSCPRGEAQGQPMLKEYTVRPSVLTVLNSRLDEQRDACFALPAVQSVAAVQESDPATYRVTVLASQAEPFERCIAAVSGMYVPEIVRGRESDNRVEWTGAQICRVTSSTTCRRLDAAQAQELDGVLSAAKPAPPGATYCEASSVLYRITLEHPSVRTMPFEAPHPCGPMKRGGQDFLLDRGQIAKVEQAYKAAATTEPAVELTDAQRAFIEDCVGRENARPAPAFLGLTEAEANPPNADAAPRRIVGRDGECLGRDDDLQSNRINLIFDQGRVIWAGWF